MQNTIFKDVNNCKLHFVFCLMLLSISSCNVDTQELLEEENDKRNVLLIGVSHFASYGKDGLQEINILNEENQDQLNQISYAIKELNPSKIYVEWPKAQQNKLDSLYQDYLSFDNEHSNHLFTNEIYQLAFRIGKMNKLAKVSAVDMYESMFPIEKIAAELDSESSKKFLTDIWQYRSVCIEEINNKIENGALIKDLIRLSNSEKFKTRDLSITHMLLEIGQFDDQLGVDVITNWYKKHLEIWSFIQKDIKLNNDKNIVVIYGLSHVAILEKLIQLNESWKIVPVESIL